MTMKPDAEPCPGRARFLSWLARHNRGQADLTASNAAMRWERKPDARHGVDCSCAAGPPEEPASDPPRRLI